MLFRSVVRSEGRDVHEMRQVWMPCRGLGDDCASVGMTDEDRLFDPATAEHLEHVDHAPGVTVQIGERCRRRAVAGQIDGDARNSSAIEFGLQRRPAPCTVPSTMNQHDVTSNHGLIVAHHRPGRPSLAACPRRLPR